MRRTVLATIPDIMNAIRPVTNVKAAIRSLCTTDLNIVVSFLPIKLGQFFSRTDSVEQRRCQASRG